MISAPVREISAIVQGTTGCPFPAKIEAPRQLGLHRFSCNSGPRRNNFYLAGRRARVYPMLGLQIAKGALAQNRTGNTT